MAGFGLFGFAVEQGYAFVKRSGAKNTEARLAGDARFQRELENRALDDPGGFSSERTFKLPKRPGRTPEVLSSQTNYERAYGRLPPQPEPLPPDGFNLVGDFSSIFFRPPGVTKRKKKRKKKKKKLVR